ncbi:hypothetical protein BC962_0526 [Gillisia mitskevichiae]|uniref:Uncharacterized protein n=1 Tax=Gillisia mitskevichiae TaxID=270921 RepID=A0A495PYE6_9FLAO|nr:DUF6544 family protein [Gillisia mitskevichiae]RKS55561.1 hypothetical protein BC962_0526 [Gillisia mitskevichiae]
MRIALTILIGLHGMIHLIGFLKAFGIFQFDAISQPVSKTLGVLFLVAFFFFAVTANLFFRRHDYWWIIGLLAVLISQFLIISFWKDTGFGSILNLVILTASIIGYSTNSFKEKVHAETAKMLSYIDTSEKKSVSKQIIADLPSPVQKWLLNNGSLGKENISSVFLKQDLQILMKPEQKQWSTAKAKQYFTIDPPAFNWCVNLEMKPWIKLVGRDKFEKGKGEMEIKLLSLFPIVNSRNDEKINQASLQRYLAEIVWFPSAVFSSYISWESIDENSARATMRYNGTEGSGVFHFDEMGDFKKFIAMRYKDTTLTEWVVNATKTELRNGIKIPVECNAAWKLEDGYWTWLKIKITHIEYNLK